MAGSSPGSNKCSAPPARPSRSRRKAVTGTTKVREVPGRTAAATAAPVAAIPAVAPRAVAAAQAEAMAVTVAAATGLAVTEVAGVAAATVASACSSNADSADWPAAFQTSWRLRLCRCAYRGQLFLREGRTRAV